MPTKFVPQATMYVDVVILDCKIILNPDFGDQPKMMNKLSYRWVGVALTSLKNKTFLYYQGSE